MQGEVYKVHAFVCLLNHELRYPENSKVQMDLEERELRPTQVGQSPESST